MLHFDASTTRRKKMEEEEEARRLNMAREAREEEAMDVTGEDGSGADRFSPSQLKLYETQFFGFTPQTCTIRINNAFLDCLYEILPIVEKVCVRQLSKGQPDGTEELLRSRARECSLNLQQFLEERFKRLSKRMEGLLVSHCFSVPPNVLLPEDQSHKNNPQDMQEVQKLESSLVNLQRAFEAEVCARQALLAELEEQREVQQQLDEILTWVHELQEAWVKEGNGSFHESFRRVMESVKKLQEAVREVLVCSRDPQ